MVEPVKTYREAVALTEDLPEGAEPGLAIEYTYRTGDAELDEQAAQLRADRPVSCRRNAHWLIALRHWPR
jgi:hypothetical protein